MKRIHPTLHIPALFMSVALIVCINLLAARFPLRLDLTEEKLYTIAPGTVRILTTLRAPVIIRVCFSKNLPPSVSRIETATRDMLNEFTIRSKGRLSVQWIDPAANDSIRESIRSLGIPGVQLQTYEQDKTALTEVSLGLIVSSGGTQEIVPIVQDLGNLEYTFIQAILKTVRTTRPTVGILVGGDLPSMDPAIARQMGMPVDPDLMRFDFIKSILSQSCDARLVNTANLFDTTIKCIVIPGTPDSTYADSTLIALEQFVNGGGDLVVLADAVRIDLASGAHARAQHPRILDLLAFWGAAVQPAIILDPSCGQITVPQNINGMTVNMPVEYPPVVFILPEGLDQSDPVVSSLGQIIFPFANPIHITDSARAHTLVSSSVNSWIDRTSFNLDPEQDWKAIYAAHFGICAQAPIVVRLSPPYPNWQNAGSPAMGDSSHRQKRSHPPEGDAPQTAGTVIVAGGSTFLTAPDNAAPGNVNWLLNTVESLTGNNDLLSIRSRALKNRALDGDRLLQDRTYAGLVRFVNILLFPALLIAGGIFIGLRRRNRQTRIALKQKPAADTPLHSVNTNDTDEDTRSCT